MDAFKFFIFSGRIKLPAPTGLALGYWSLSLLLLWALSCSLLSLMAEVCAYYLLCTIYAFYFFFF